MDVLPFGDYKKPPLK